MANRVLMLTHTDLDGLSCAVIARLFRLPITWFKTRDYPELFDMNGDLSVHGTFDFVYVTDLNVSQKMIDSLNKKADDYLIFDHHLGSREFHDGERIFVDTEKSGTELLFDYLSKGKRTPHLWQEYATIVSVYDLWKTEHPKRGVAEDLNRVYFRMLNYKKDPSDFTRYQKFLTVQLRKLQRSQAREFYFTDYEQERIQEAKRKEEDEYQKALQTLQKRYDEKGYAFGIYKGKSKVSYVCNRILTDNPDLYYVVNVNTWPDGVSGKLSVRSRDDFDVTSLQSINGHVNAGGGEVSKRRAEQLFDGTRYEVGYEEVKHEQQDS